MRAEEQEGGKLKVHSSLIWVVTTNMEAYLLSTKTMLLALATPRSTVLFSLQAFETLQWQSKISQNLECFLVHVCWCFKYLKGTGWVSD